MLEMVLNPDRTVEIPLVGTYVMYEGKSYVVVQTTTYQEQDPNNVLNVIFTTLASLLRVNDEGDDLGETIIRIESDKLTEI